MIDIPKHIISRIENFHSFSESSHLILKTTNLYNIINNNKKVKLFINLELINNIRRINKFHEGVNTQIKTGDYYVICSETLEERRKRIWRKAPFGTRNLVRVIDFIYKRVFPKLPILNKIYFAITRGYNRVLSKAEILGRLISCGFEIMDYFEYNNLLYII